MPNRGNIVVCTFPTWWEKAGHPAGHARNKKVAIGIEADRPRREEGTEVNHLRRERETEANRDPETEVNQEEGTGANRPLGRSTSDVFLPKLANATGALHPRPARGQGALRPLGEKDPRTSGEMPHDI